MAESLRKLTLGNALRHSTNAADSAEVRAALQARAQDGSALVREHVAWALDQKRLQPNRDVRQQLLNQ